MTLPKTARGFDACDIIADEFSRRMILIPRRTTDTIADLHYEFETNVFKYFGYPNRIRADRESRMKSSSWSNLMSKIGVELDLCTTDHHRANGLAE